MFSDFQAGVISSKLLNNMHEFCAFMLVDFNSEVRRRGLSGYFLLAKTGFTLHANQVNICLLFILTNLKFLFYIVAL